MKRLTVLVVVLAFAVPLSFGQMMEQINTDVFAKIKDEGMNRSQVMETLSYLSDVYGPRLTWSPEYKEAAEWASKQLKAWGVQNVHFENFDNEGKAWSLKKFYATALTPRSFPIIAYPKAWSPGTKGVVKGEAVLLDVKTEADLAKYKGKLKNAFVLISEPRELEAHFTPDGVRLADSSLLDLADAGMPGAGRRGRRNMFDSTRIARYLEQAQLNAKMAAFCMEQGAAAMIDCARGDFGTVFVQQASVPRAPKSLQDLFSSRVNAYAEDAPPILPQISFAAEHYNRIARMIQKGQHVRLEMDLEVEMSKKASPGFNIVGEIPGTDLKDEIVMVGGHFDSWQAGTGATDNGTGSSVAMEVVRILKTLNIKPRRTIRIGLWGGEEQGLLGSRGYVKDHLGERKGDLMQMMMGRATGPVEKKGDYEKFSVYFNNDNGGGRVRGVYLQGNEDARMIFRQWFAEMDFPEAQTISLGNTGGTDHLSFDAIGLPGFQYIQDPIEYSTRTHHSNMDLYDRVQPDDLKQAATIEALCAYQAAMRDGMFPRKPEPSGQGQRAASGR